jgi:hypothetical protein
MINNMVRNEAETIFKNKYLMKEFQRRWNVQEVIKYVRVTALIV